jgi:6-pyruvoyl tetrahydropterin synthase/QueD family protein
MYRIGKLFTFDSAHHLPSLPPGHKCSRVHGHTYTVELAITAEALTGPGFVTGFGRLKPFKDYVDQHLDHQDLNKVLDPEPTAEHLAATWPSGSSGISSLRSRVGCRPFGCGKPRFGDTAAPSPCTVWSGPRPSSLRPRRTSPHRLRGPACGRWAPVRALPKGRRRRCDDA